MKIYFSPYLSTKFPSLKSPSETPFSPPFSPSSPLSLPISFSRSFSQRDRSPQAHYKDIFLLVSVSFPKPTEQPHLPTFFPKSRTQRLTVHRSRPAPSSPAISADPPSSTATVSRPTADFGPSSAAQGSSSSSPASLFPTTGKPQRPPLQPIRRLHRLRRPTSPSPAPAPAPLQPDRRPRTVGPPSSRDACISLRQPAFRRPIVVSALRIADSGPFHHRATPPLLLRSIASNPIHAAPPSLRRPPCRVLVPCHRTDLGASRKFKPTFLFRTPTA